MLSRPYATVQRGLRQETIVPPWIKGTTVKAVWICGLLCLLSLVAFGRNSIAVSATGDPRSEAQAAPSGATFPPSLDEYVFLHATRSAGIAQQAAVRANVCRGPIRGARG